MKSKKQKVLVFGRSGLLGSEFVDFLSKDDRFNVFGFDSKSSNLTDYKKTFEILKKIRPDVVINCAAKINIDQCEIDPLGTWMVNSVGPGNIAHSLRVLGGRSIFLHISTSTVFDGKNVDGYKEDDLPAPINVYGWSKFAGEKIIEEELKNCKFVDYYIIRSGWLYGKSRQTFVDIIVNSLKSATPVDLVSDQYSVPTWTADLVKQYESFFGNRKFKSGIYHLENNYKKPVSKYDVGVFISKQLGLDHRVLKPCSAESFFKTRRPSNASLVNTKTEGLPNWEQSMIKYLKLQF